MPNKRKSITQNSSSTALLKWEAAGEKLATALSAYHHSCIVLDTFCDEPSQDAKNMASRVDASLLNLHPKLLGELSGSRVVLAQMRNRISARSYLLPKEILAEIFKAVVYTPGHDDELFPSMVDGLKRVFGRLHSLLGVCSTWRNLAIELSELWSIIPVAHQASICPTPSSASLTLQRSRALTSERRYLHLAAILSEPHYGHLAPFSDKNIPSFTSINIEARFKSATHHTADLLDKLLDSQSPSVISELSLHHYQDPLEDFPPPRIPKKTEYIGYCMSAQRLVLLNQLIKSLSIFRVRNINLRWNTIAFSDKLVEIHLQSVVLGDNSKLLEFLHVLESAPELRNLRLISVTAFARGSMPNSNTGSAKIILPNLQTLLLDDLPYNVLETVLSSVAPGSHKIKVRLTSKSNSNQILDDESDWDDDYQPVISLLKRSNVDTLFLSPLDDGNDEDWSPWVDREELSRKLHSLPNLKTLIMHDWKWDLGAILALDRNSYPRIPRLTGLYILDGYITDAGLLPQVVASHSLQTLVLDDHPSCIFDCDRDSLVESMKTMVPDFRLIRGLGGMNEFNYYSWRLW